MASKRDYYAVLNVPKAANEQEIKRAFRTLAMQYHPDRNKSPDAENRFKEINEAYDVLSDPKKRAIYDQYGHDGLRGGPAGPGPFASSQGFDASDIFSQMFGADGDSPFADIFGGNTSTRTSTRRGRDVIREVPITFKQWVLGTDVKINVQVTRECNQCHGSGANSPGDVITCQTCHGRGYVTQVARTMFGNVQTQASCPTCQGAGKRVTKSCPVCRGAGSVQANETITVGIPSGITENEHVVVSGYGAPGTRGGPPGDLAVSVRVSEAKYLRRNGDNVIMELPVDPFQAMAGARIKVPTFSGIREISIPKGSVDGQRITIANEGFYTGRKVLNKRGDLIVVLKYAPTRPLSREEQAFIEHMALQDNPAAKDRLEKIIKEVE